MQPSRTILFVAGSVLLSAVAGCRRAAVTFPARPMEAEGAFAAWDTDEDGRIDLLFLADERGRIVGMARDTDGDARAESTVDLDAIPASRCRHLMIILDGVGYRVIRELYNEGHFRLMHPPSRVIAPYPTMTDLSLEDLLAYIPCEGFEALYYDHRENRLVGGSMAYLSGESSPYNQLLHYRAKLIWDVVGYLYPRKVFDKELNDLKRLFDERKTSEVLAYLVSSAGVVTNEGEDAQRSILLEVERLIHQVVWETNGLVKVTLVSDHGHTYARARRIPLEEHLRSGGWRICERLTEPNDVAYIRFGLETYVSLATRRPEALAEHVIGREGVELASFAEGATAVVLGAEGSRALIDEKDGRFRYRTVKGDPLGLSAILEGLEADGDGFHDADPLLRATADHKYPAPLQRIRRAHFGLVQNPPDVIVSLADEWYSGSTTFAGAVEVASTHGSLNRANSTTFVMTSAGPLPELLRMREIPAALGEVLGRPFPYGR